MANTAVDRAEEALLKSNPPNAQMVINELSPLLDAPQKDPRVPLYLAMALALSGKRDDAKILAEKAVRLSQYLTDEANALLGRLNK